MTSLTLDDDHLARAVLTYLAEPADVRLGALIRVHGAVRTLEAIKAGSFPRSVCAVTDCAQAAAELAAHAADRRSMQGWQARLPGVPSADAMEEFCRSGIRLICPGDPEWPVRLADLGAAMPYALWLRGNADLRFSCLRSVAIVGARAATAYGAYVASEFAACVAARGWAVVSGGAYGVDAAAHRGALAADGVTVAVLACGVDVPYPAGHADLLDAIAAQGVVVSEWPPGRNATRLRFLVRNRTIAALAGGTLVVEAARRSGALNSARHARDLGRPLMAVPGPITSEQSAGCHTVIREWQGMLVTSAADVIEYLSPLGSTADDPALGSTADDLAPGQAKDPAAVGRDCLDTDAATVLDALPLRGGMGPARIAAKAGLDPDRVLRCLGTLAAAGFAERCDQGWRLRRG
jgi:DNA processing protein